MDTTLAIILKAQDQMSGAFKAATGAAQGLDTASTEAGDALQTAGQQAEKGAGQTEDAAAASRALMAALERQANASEQSAASLKKLEAGLDKTKKGEDEAKKGGESFATTLHSLLGIAAMAGKVLSGAFQLVSESMGRMAEDGDKASQSVLGQFKSMQHGGDEVTASFAGSLAPALQPVSKAINGMTHSMAEWVRANDLGRKAVVVTLSGLLAIATAAQVTRDAVNDLVVGLVQWTGMGDAVKKYGENLMKNAGATDALAKRNQALIDTMQTLDAWEGKAPKSQEQIRKELFDTSGQAKDTSDSLYELRQSLAKLIEDSKNSKDLDVSFISLGSSKEAKEQEKGDLEKHISDLGDIIQKGLDDTYEKRVKANETTHELFEKQKEEELQGFQKFFEDRSALIQAQTEEEIFAAETSGATAEEVALRKIAAYQREADAYIAGSEKRTDAERKATLEIQKLGETLAANWKDKVTKIQTVFTSMATVLLDSSKSTKEKLKEVFGQITDMITANMQKQLETAIETSAKSAAASAAGAAKEAGAASAGIVPKILSKAAELPFPANTIVAGLAIAAFNVLAKKIVSFFEFGGPVESGNVGGFGRRDSVPAQLTPGEFVLRPEAVRGIGRETLERANQTGQLPDGGGGSTVMNAHFTIEAGRGVVLMPQQVAQEVGPYIADTLNAWVKNHGGILYASDLLVSLPQPAGA